MKENEANSPSRAIRRVVFWGATGQAKVLKECIDHTNLELLALFDNNKSLSSPFKGIPLYYEKQGLENWLRKHDTSEAIGFFAAIGGDKGKDRLILQEYAVSLNLEPLIAIHPRAFVAEDTQIGPGTQVMANSAVCVGSTLGDACIVNTGASVDHDCRIGDGVHIGPGATLAGCVEIDDLATVYSGAVVLPRVKLGKNAIVGAGAIVRNDVPPDTIVVGNPAKPLKGT
jgi:sugar O-acyltransferase (sialic acid O-acetyltransferase NeuD family)